MNQETIDKFKDYKFSDDQKWQKYLQDLYPVPPLDRMNKLKKKWYKTNVDQNFDNEADLDAPQTNQSNQQY